VLPDIYINDNLTGRFDDFSLLTSFMITFLRNYPVVLLPPDFCWVFYQNEYMVLIVFGVEIINAYKLFMYIKN